MKRSRLQWHYRTVLLVRFDWSRGLPGGTRLKSRELPTILTSARVCLYSERILCGHPSNEERLNVHLPLAVHGANRRLSNQVSPCPVRLGTTYSRRVRWAKGPAPSRGHYVNRKLANKSL